MKPKIEYRPKSYENAKGRWVPSGIVVLKDLLSITEFTETYSLTKNSKAEANAYFIKNTKKIMGNCPSAN